MDNYLITTRNSIPVLNVDYDFGFEVVIGFYSGEEEDVAKDSASKEHNIPIHSLIAYRLF